MRLQIESTNITTSLGGVMVRLWEGVTENGTPCKVFVHRLAVRNDCDAADFDHELQEQLPPAEERVIPLSMIL